MEVKLNAEIRNYSESLFFGLSTRQFVCSFIAVAVSVAVYFLAGDMNDTVKGLLCVLAASPFGAVGFLKINGMSADRYALAMLRFARTKKQLVYRSSSALYNDLKKRGVIDP